MGAGAGGPRRVGGSLKRLRQEVLDYFARVEEVDSDVAITGLPPQYPPAPKLLVLFNRCEDWNCLPLAGGLLDQPAYLMMALDAVRIAVKERLRIEAINMAATRKTEEVVGEKTQPLPGIRKSCKNNG